MKPSDLGSRVVLHGPLRIAARASAAFGLMKQQEDAFGSDETAERSS